MTLMQDRHRQFDEIFLQRTAGPYIGVKRVTLGVSRSLPVYAQLWTCRRIATTEAMCQTRKSSMQYGVIEEEVNDHDTFHKP
jgi:hypothetical protein